jgi:hypothetical protein
LPWFEAELLTCEENLVGLMAVNRDVIGQAETLDRSDRVVKTGRKAGEMPLKMSGASRRASQFGPPGGYVDARSIRG